MLRLPTSLAASALFVLSIVNSATRDAVAQPSHKNPGAPIPVFGGEESQKLATLATARYETAFQEIRAIAKKLEQNKPATLQGRDIQQASTAINQMARAAVQLKHLSEPAGHDFALRSNLLADVRFRAIQAYVATPPGSKFADQCRQRVAQSEALRARQVKELEQLAKGEKWEVAENQWYEFKDKLESLTQFLTPDENRVIYAPFGPVTSAIEGAMRRIRAKRGQEILAQQRQAQTPDFAAFLQQVDEASRAIGSQGQATIGGQMLTGPAAIGYLAEKWKEIHIQALRCRALDWALQAIPNAAGADALSAMPEAQTGTKEPMVNAYNKFSTDALSGLARLIEADAARVPEAEVSALYAQYLAVLAPFSARASTATFLTALEPPLEKLAAKSATFAQNVKSYKLATDDVLRWRQRTAQAMTQARASKVRPVDSHLQPAFKSTEMYRGLFPVSDENVPPPTLLNAAPAVLEPALPQLIDQETVVRNLASLGAGKPSIGRYQNRVYVSARVAGPTSAAVESLAADLFSSANAPPLSLAAAVALNTAQQGDLAAAGGKITGVFLEGWISRFAALPPSASAIVPLATMPQERIAGELVGQVVIRFDVSPTWIQHSHFFLELPPPSVAMRTE